MFNFKLITKKILGNTVKEMELFLDCMKGNLTKSKLWDYILHYRIDINAQFAGREISTIGNDGETPLMFYLKSSNCDLQIVEFMISEGANAAHESRWGLTPAHMLASGQSKDKLKILKLLKKAGADFDVINSSGMPCAGNYISSGASREQLDYILSNCVTTKDILEKCPFPQNRDAFAEIIVQLSHRGEPYIRESVEMITTLIKHGFNLNKRVSHNKETPLKMLKREIENLGKKRSKSRRTSYPFPNDEKRMFVYKEIEELLISHGATV